MLLLLLLLCENEHWDNCPFIFHPKFHSIAIVGAFRCVCVCNSFLVDSSELMYIILKMLSYNNNHRNCIDCLLPQKQTKSHFALHTNTHSNIDVVTFEKTIVLLRVCWILFLSFFFVNESVERYEDFSMKTINSVILCSWYLLFQLSLSLFFCWIRIQFYSIKQKLVLYL